MLMKGYVQWNANPTAFRKGKLYTDLAFLSAIGLSLERILPQAGF